MRSKNTILLTIATVCFSAGIWTGCTVGFDVDQAGVFPCTSNDDCIQGYECSIGDGEAEGVCEEPPPPDEAPPCDKEADPEGDIDLDNDGYGTGPNRTNCPQATRAEEDCDDNDPNVFPGAGERCNGADDDCDTEVDEFDCQIADDCGPEPTENDLNDFFYYACESNTCVMRPYNQPGECSEVAVTCNPQEQAFTYELGGQTYNATELPDECR